ncbi:50S ribosomal protein L4, chloroplastic [Dendrobium catenatum]|uniref:Large ribosomal subunit protein uL4c n=1 Tax=Dendrobium catenatum TaxID=906689 RepID=A0A2I0X722_9ASPA|nr:50S ribosomal protein L4, chloroplastic [Dendrobium catenatum]
MSIISSQSPLSFSASSIFLPTPKSLFVSAFNPSPRTTTLLSSSKTLTLIRASSSSLPIFSFTGETIGNALLVLKSAPPDTARAVVHRAIIAEQQNQRRGTASTLTRGEVSGGGKKPYPQKKTGRARRGSQRTPLRPGGGVIFGPKPKDWSIKINRKERRLALSTAIASAASSSDALVVEDFAHLFDARPKTKDFIAAMRRWGLDPKDKSLFLLTEVPDNVKLSCRNIGTLKMLTPRTLNLFDILDSAKLVLTKSAVDYLNSMYGEGSEKVDDEEEDEDGEQAAPEAAAAIPAILLILGSQGTTNGRHFSKDPQSPKAKAQGLQCPLHQGDPPAWIHSHLPSEEEEGLHRLHRRGLGPLKCSMSCSLPLVCHGVLMLVLREVTGVMVRDLAGNGSGVQTLMARSRLKQVDLRSSERSMEEEAGL